MNEVIEKIEPRIYVGTYAKYNDGSIAGKWLDLNDYEDINAFYKACKKLHKDESDPELMFQDWEYIPASMIWESGLNPEFYDLLEVVNDSNLSYEIYLAAVDDGFDFNDLEDYYMGEFESDIDFTESMNCDYEPTTFVTYYIDWERCARDYMMDFFEIEGHYFSNN
jgi:antirestriction protein